MKRALKALVILALIDLAAGGGGFLYLRAQASAPGPHAQAVRVLIAQGSGVTAIARQLESAGVVKSALSVRLWARLSGRHTKLRAGEYDVPAGASVADILALLESGETVARKLTLPEGLTVAEALSLVRGAEGLSGDISRVPDDGRLLPETYHYSWGDSRDDVVARMVQSMEDTVADVWDRRPQGFPLATPAELVTLASIVEKETGLPEERPMVAGVFLNRLRLGMKLQSDPTVVYALTGGAGPLGRALTRDDLKTDSPYNTYVVTGLPPAPIANPGRASLEAVIRPAATDALYFVADGSGGHVFARTLEEHNANVAKWRRWQRQNGG